MIGFGIDEIQAEYVAEIKLRHLNREYILKRTKDLEDLEKEIAELDEILKKQGKNQDNHCQRTQINCREIRSAEKEYHNL